jgi:predicted membrane-bound mannosyltransferase
VIRDHGLVIYDGVDMNEAIQHPKSEIRNKKLTVEAGLYAAIIALAVGVRLYRLGLAPLAAGEAELAWSAWRGDLPPAGVSPLLTWIAAGLFAVFGSRGAAYSAAVRSAAEYGDALARLAPALIGVVLVALPMLLRDRLGRIGALGAAVVLAISPVAVMTSRTASGDTLAAAALLGLVVIGARYWADGRSGWLYAGAAALGLGLVSGSTFYSALVMLAVCAGLLAVRAPAQARAFWQSLRARPKTWQIALSVLAAVFMSGATAFAWKTAGLSAAGESLSAWVAGFSSGAADWAWPLKVLAVYELLTLVVGVIGLGLLLRPQTDRLAVSLAAGLAVALALAAARSGQGQAIGRNADVLLAVIPLALLGGYALQALADSFRAISWQREEGVLILILLPVMAYVMLSIAGYAVNGSAVTSNTAAPNTSFNLGPAAQLVQALLAVALAVVVISLFGALGGTEIALRGAALALLIVLALATWSTGWRAAQLYPGDPRELLAGPEATSTDVRDLTNDLSKLSADMTTDATTLSFMVQGAPGGVLGWYLRQWPRASFVPRLDAAFVERPTAAARSVFITTDSSPALSISYAGQRYTLAHTWQTQGQPAGGLLKWLLYRKAELPQPTRQVTLWVKQ